MQGLIRLKTILAHPIIIIQEYGWKIYARCIITGLLVLVHLKKAGTFLSLIFEKEKK